MKISGLICNMLGHKPITTKIWMDNNSGFVRATEKCTRCEYTYDWEPFYLTPGGTEHFTSLEEFEINKDGWARPLWVK